MDVAKDACLVLMARRAGLGEEEALDCIEVMIALDLIISS